jgi:hypothetical protein
VIDGSNLPFLSLAESLAHGRRFSREPVCVDTVRMNTSYVDCVYVEVPLEPNHGSITASVLRSGSVL